MFNALKKYLPGIAGILLVLCTALAGCTPEAAATVPATTNQSAAPQTTAVQNNTSIATTALQPQTSSPPDTSQVEVPASPEPEYIPKPAPGFEFRVPLEYDRWTVEDFTYEILHSPGEDYRFPWCLVIQNDTGSSLPLTAYIIHWGFHGWVGFVTETPFTLEPGETKTLSGEDVFGQTAYEEMLYLESTHLDIYIAPR
jgi:hypothetical protein